MKVTKESLFEIGTGLNIPEDKLEALWEALNGKEQFTESSPFARYLYYFGALVTISAMTWFMGLGWLVFGGGGIFFIASLYALLFFTVGSYMWNKITLRIPAGLLITIAVCMVPLAIYGLQLYFNLISDTTEYPDFFSWVNSRWIWMELGTIAAGLAALRFYPFSFLMAPVAVAAWFLSMDIVPAIIKEDTFPDVRYWVSIVFGALLIAAGLIFDRRKLRDHAFWCYLFGAIAFWGGLGSLVWNKDEGVLFVYALINIALMCFSILIKRNVFMVFGGLGIFAYLAHLADKFFRDSTAFPFILSLIGMLIIALGIIYQRNSKTIDQALRRSLPQSLRDYFDF